MSEPIGFLPGPNWHPPNPETNSRRGDRPRSSPPATTARREFVGFDREQATYDAAHAGLLSRSEGQYVVVVRDEIAGPVATFHEAMKLGYARFGPGPLLIKQILAWEPASETTRDIDPCRP